MDQMAQRPRNSALRFPPPVSVATWKIYRSQRFCKFAVLRICYHIHNKTTRARTDGKFRCQCQVNKRFTSTAQPAVCWFLGN